MRQALVVVDNTLNYIKTSGTILAGNQTNFHYYGQRNINSTIWAVFLEDCVLSWPPAFKEYKTKHQQLERILIG